MTISSRAENAVIRKHEKNNCCQAVLLACEDKLGLSELELKKIGASLGFGLGDMEGPCGALLGAEIVQGLLASEGKGINPLSKSLQKTFAKKTGALRCKEIKGIDSGELLCSCDECCKNAILSLEENGIL